MATHASILACRVPRTEEPGGLQPVGSPRVRLSNLHCASLQGPRHTGCTREGALSASVVSVCSHLSASEDRGPFPGGGESSFSAGHRRQRCRSLTPPQPAPALQTSGPKSSAGCSLHAAHSTLLTAAVTRRRLAGAACPHLVTAAYVHPAVRYRITGDQQQAEDPRKPRAATPGASTRGTAPPVACRRACSAAQLCPAPCHPRGL